MRDRFTCTDEEDIRYVEDFIAAADAEDNVTVPNLCQFIWCLDEFTGVCWHSGIGQTPQVTDLVKNSDLR
jgi:hypothetical protein